MAKFDYTYKGWDKARPTLLPSTGLGKVLKAFEKQKARCLSGGGCWAEDFADAYKALDDVEKARLEALKLCKDKKHDKAADYLASADLKAERGLLAAPIGNRLVNLLTTLDKQVSDLMLRYDNRIKMLEEALETIKKKEMGKVLKYADKLVTNDGNEGRPKFAGQDQLKEALNPKYGLKREPALNDLLTKLRAWNERVIEIGEKSKRSEELLRLLTPLIQGGQKKLLEGKDPNAVF